MMDYRLQSPYCSGFKVPMQQKGLIMQHLLVRKLTRRELEDKYLRLIDENYDLKRENNVQKEKIKVLTTKLLRMTKENSRYKSREFLFMDENNEIHEAEEFFRGRRPASSSAIPRKSLEDSIRNSTPNLSSKFNKSEISLNENMGGSHGNNSKAENSGINVEANNKIRDMQEEIERLTDELRKLQEIGELEKQTNAQLEIQINELKEQLTGKKMQMELETSLEIAELNKRIKELHMELRETEARYKRKLDENISENEKLAETLEKERNKVKRYEAQVHDFEASQKMIDELMQQISALEKEKADLAVQYEKYATITDEVLSYKKRMNEIETVLDERERELEKERADRASIEHSQEELLKKMKDLQKENDELVVKLEGLKTENDCLINKNKKLEDRIKSLETENKHQLQQINETLRLPTPIIREDDLTVTCSKEIQRIHEIQHQIVKQKSVEITSPEDSQPTSRRVSAASANNSNLSIPSVVIDDEKRPATPEKDLKIIPTIIEPVPSESSKQTEEHFTNTINSQDAPNIPPDSPLKRGFAETFSRSISRDEGDDEFDPKTFSIDQKTVKEEKASRKSQLETSIERAKEILLKDIFKRNTTSQIVNTKRVVRMSVEAKTLSPIYSRRESNQSNNSNVDVKKINLAQYSIKDYKYEKKRKNSRESLAEFLKRSSSQNSSYSSSSKSRSSTPQLLLDHIDDEKILLKHNTHSIDIEIIKLEMTEGSSLLEDEFMKFLYVEYSFMNYNGYLLETQALKKPKKAGDSTYYRFKRTFDVSPEDENFKYLKEMIEKKSKVPLKFLIVSEPLDADEEDDDSNCEEVGFACIKLNKVLETAKGNSQTIKADCFSTAYPHELIAYLHVKITGIEILQKLSLMK